MSSPPPGKRAKGGMIRIPSYIAAALGLRSCEVREDEIQGRMLLAGIATESDVFNSPILFGLMYHARDVFLDRVVPKLDRLDLVMLSEPSGCMSVSGYVKACPFYWEKVCKCRHASIMCDRTGVGDISILALRSSAPTEPYLSRLIIRV